MAAHNWPSLTEARDGPAIEPEAARFDGAPGEFVPPYEAVRTADDADGALLSFLETPCAAAADLAGWDRPALECPPGRPRVVRRL